MAKQASKSAPRNLHAEISTRILDSLKQGVIPWRKPWSAYGSGMTPRNAVTNRPYSGGNVVLLWMTATEKGFGLPLWLTFKQAQEAGGNVIKGQKGTQVVYVSTFVRMNEATGKEERIPFLKSFTVFNVDQCEGLPEFGERKPVNPDQRDQEAEDFMVSTGAVITHGEGQAYYSRTLDLVNLPRFEAFKTSSGYYATAFHELAHWTGAPHRLDRVKGKRFGDREYAFEELVAELTSAFACAEFGFDNDTLDNSASYIDNWIKVLTDHEKMFMSAASSASQALEYMRGLALDTLSADDVVTIDAQASA